MNERETPEYWLKEAQDAFVTNLGWMSLEGPQNIEEFLALSEAWETVGNKAVVEGILGNLLAGSYQSFYNNRTGEMLDGRWGEGVRSVS